MQFQSSLRKRKTRVSWVPGAGGGGVGEGHILQLQILEPVTFGGQTPTQGQSYLLRNGRKLTLSSVVEKYFQGQLRQIVEAKA